MSACTPFRQALSGAGYTNTKELPRGQVIAIARLTDCIATATWTPPEDSNEYAFGNYEAIDGESGRPRYSFKLEDVRKLPVPFDCKGALGIWKLPRSITDSDLSVCSPALI